MNGNDPFSALTRLWTETATQAMQAMMPATGSTESPELVRKTRAELMQFWSELSEQWLRSSGMLQAQKQMLDGNLSVRKQCREALRKMQRELQLVGREDIDAVIAAIRRSERRVLDRLDETAAQMQAIEAKINRLNKRMIRSGTKKKVAGSSPNGARKRRAAEKE